ncbi:MAG: sulfurtransferase [Candidatus Eisenbacteria bacterium]|nr:sulfurtransferase [Candidatus Eisenbacteria bacterium]
MSREYPHGSGVVKLVSTEWLAEHVGDGVALVDCQPNVHDYIKEHIAGAVYMNEGLLRVPKKGLPAVYAPEEAIQTVFRRIGLEADRPVVVYTGKGPFKGWGDGLEQVMVAYSMARFGHNSVHVLDGGIDKWKSEDREVVQAFPKVEESSFDVSVRDEYFIAYDDFREMKDDDDVILLDARPGDVYEGQGPWMKPGHIPGAVNVPWKSFMHPDNPRLLKSDKEIREIVERHGISEDKTVICSCGTGREATNEFILFKWYLGYPNVRIYEGSFTEWSSYPDNPTVTGKSPR